ncbi:MAG: sensor histidine kinase, partial [Chthoniobacteraceae bacterium]
MTLSQRQKLAATIRGELGRILEEWRRQVKVNLPGAQGLDVPTLNDHVGAVIEDLAKALDDENPELVESASSRASPPAHGQERLREGFDIVEVVAEYGILRSVVFAIVNEHGINPEFSSAFIINKVLDDSIGLAVQAFAEEQARAIDERRREHLSFVAHDLRTPLLAVSISAGALREELGHPHGSPDVDELIDTIRSNTQCITALVSQILEEERNVKALAAMAIERRHIHLWPLVEKLRQDLKPLAVSNGTAIRNGVPRTLVLFADARLLNQALQNLLTNAIKFTNLGEVHVEATSIEGGAICHVRDNGAGIPAE